MADYKLILPAMGEGNGSNHRYWLKTPGDMIEEDDAVVEIATDKVDRSTIPSGKLKEILVNEEDIKSVML